MLTSSLLGQYLVKVSEMEVADYWVSFRKSGIKLNYDKCMKNEVGVTRRATAGF